MASESSDAPTKKIRQRFFQRKVKGPPNIVVSPSEHGDTPPDTLESIVEGVACVSYGNYYTVSGVGANALRDTFNKNYYLLDRSGAAGGAAAAEGAAEPPKKQEEPRKTSNVTAPTFGVADSRLRRSSDAANTLPNTGGVTSGMSLTAATSAKMRNFFGMGSRQRSQSETQRPTPAFLQSAPGVVSAARRKVIMLGNRETKTVVSGSLKKFKVTPASAGAAAYPPPMEAPRIGPTEFVEMYRQRGQSDTRSEAMRAARALACKRKVSNR